MVTSWWSERRERARKTRAAKAFNRAFTTALAERLGISKREATSMVKVVAFDPSNDAASRVQTSMFSLDSASTKQLPSEGAEAKIFGVAVAYTLAALESLKDTEVFRLILEGTLTDRKGWEYAACVLSVEATREVAESLNWDNLENKQVLENFDLRYAGGKQVLAHGGGPDMDGVAEDLTTLSPTDFEKRIVNLFEAMGYVVEHTGRTGDHGIDLVATSSVPITGGKFVIQCKRYAEANNVGESEVRDLYGVVTHERASKGILVTTSDFTSAARVFATDKQLELINGGKLAELLETHFGKPRSSPETPDVPNPKAG